MTVRYYSHICLVAIYPRVGGLEYRGYRASRRMCAADNVCDDFSRSERTKGRHRIQLRSTEYLEWHVSRGTGSSHLQRDRSANLVRVTRFAGWTSRHEILG